MMNIELEEGSKWKHDRVHIDVYRTDQLLNFRGYIEGHKIVEIEKLNEECCAVKTIGWTTNDQ